MHGGLILRHTHRTAPGKARPWPVGVGLTIGAAVSVALWAGIVKLAIAALG